MTLKPSPKFQDEFVVSDTDDRGRAIVESMVRRQFGTHCSLTRAKAHKADLLYRFGFSAVRTDAGWRYQRGKARPMPLHFAMWCVEAMQ